MIDTDAPRQQRTGEICPDAVLCFSHLRWDFVYQRPQHLMSRLAKRGPVFYFEEPMFIDGPPGVAIREVAPGLKIVVPRVPRGEDLDAAEKHQRAVVDHVIGMLPAGSGIVAWYYTSMALAFTDHLVPGLCIYDCMDELSAFLGAPVRLRTLEADLFRRADLIFTGGQSLFEAKRRHHPSVHAFPSSIDKAHFQRARNPHADDPADQAGIPGPRIGFFGVIDERMDLGLVSDLADANNDLQFVMIGPVVKIDPGALPRRSNIHWLGAKGYDELPDYMARWNAGFMPFALNEATRFISPTKTPEFLAGGIPVVSSAIRDVVKPYEELGLVEIGSNVDDWSSKLRRALTRKDQPAWLRGVDAYLADLSWDATFARMADLMDGARGADVAYRNATPASEDRANV
jgi:glycosyltransferase involved in cell wall biosynthesis